MGRMGFRTLIGRRLLQVVPIIVFATFVVFSLLHLVPGDPALMLAGDYASKERIEEIRKLLRLRSSAGGPVRRLALARLQGDLGVSLLSSAIGRST